MTALQLGQKVKVPWGDGQGLARVLCQQGDQVEVRLLLRGGYAPDTTWVPRADVHPVGKPPSTRRRGRRCHCGASAVAAGYCNSCLKEQGR